MPLQFDYPQNGWSTGKMRKRGQQLAMDLQRRGQPDAGMLTEMEKAAGFGISARGVTGGMGAAVPSQGIVPQPVQRAEIQDAVNSLAQGDLTPQGFKKKLKAWGWSGDHETGQFTDPDGNQHQITPTEAR